jgi:hypothetical protein
MRREGQTLDDALRPLQVEEEQALPDDILPDEVPEQQPAS